VKGEFPFALRTGEKAPNKHLRISLEDLLQLDAARKASRFPLTIEEVNGVFQATAGVPLREEVLQMIGSEDVKHWEAIYHPDAPSILIVGGKNPTGDRLEFEDATATILIRRVVQDGLDSRVVFNSARFAGYVPDSNRLIEFSYCDPKVFDRYPRRVPRELQLSHIGFSVSNEEVPEDLDSSPTDRFVTDHGFYPGNDVTNEHNGNTMYAPGYWTFPIHEEIDILFDNATYHEEYYHGSVVTARMRALTGENKRRLRTKYCEWAIKPEHVLYLGGEQGFAGDPAGLSGFYSKYSDGSVEFGRNIDSPREPSWSFTLPTYLRKS